MTDRDADAVAVVTAALDLAAALQAGIDIALDAEQLTPPLASALWVLDPSHPPQPRKAVAAQLRCDPSNVTLIADRLAALGLLQRVPDPEDRRVKALALTTHGVQARARLLHALAAGLPLDRLTDADLGQLARLLRHVTSADRVGPASEP